MKITTTEVDGNTLSAKKEVEASSKKIETPAKALQVGKLRSSEKVSSLARGVAELYRKTNAVSLDNSRSGWTGLADKLRLQAKDANDDELVIPFIQYEDTAALTGENAAEIAKLQTNYGDMVVVPIMTPLVDAADDGDSLSSNPVSAILENTKVFLDAVEELNINKPVMGTIPPVSESCTRALTELYNEKAVQAYCVDFNRRSPMAQSQLNNVIIPLMQILRNYDLQEKSLMYAVNVNDSRRTGTSYRTADAMYSYTIGFDIIGDNHIPPNWPEEVFEKIEEQNKGSETTLRLFDKDTASIVEVGMSELNSFIPDEAEIPVGRVQQRIAADVNEKYRFTNLINAELISLYIKSGDGIDPSEIFRDLSMGAAAQDTDLERVRKLASEVGEDT